MREGIEFKMTRPDLRLFETKIFAGTSLLSAYKFDLLWSIFYSAPLPRATSLKRKLNF